MTMLTHIGGPSRPARHPSAGRHATSTGAASAPMAMLKRFGRGALATLIVGGALGGIIALRVAIHLSRLNY